MSKKLDNTAGGHDALSGLRDHAEIVRIFWTSPDNALFPPSIVAVVTERTVNTLEKLRSIGEGPAFRSSGKTVYYSKRAVCCWLESSTVEAANAREAQHLLAQRRNITLPA